MYVQAVYYLLMITDARLCMMYFMY